MNLKHEYLIRRVEDNHVIGVVQLEDDFSWKYFCTYEPMNVHSADRLFDAIERLYDLMKTQVQT